MVKQTVLFVFGVVAITVVVGLLGAVGLNLAGAHDSPPAPPAQRITAPAYAPNGR